MYLFKLANISQILISFKTTQKEMTMRGGGGGGAEAGTMTQFSEAFYGLVGQRVRAQAITCPITMSAWGRGGLGGVWEWTVS